MVYPQMSEVTVIARILFALLLGMAIGLERQIRKTETNNHGAAGLRTNALVCMGSALITAVGTVVFGLDIRLAASIMTGVGFIGAGTIMASDKKDMGLTNAAAVWASASVGIAVGVGLYFSATIATMITLIVLQLRKFEKFE